MFCCYSVPIDSVILDSGFLNEHLALRESLSNGVLVRTSSASFQHFLSRKLRREVDDGPLHLRVEQRFAGSRVTRLPRCLRVDRVVHLLVRRPVVVWEARESSVLKKITIFIIILVKYSVIR